jgi:ribose transport system permease protein
MSTNASGQTRHSARIALPEDIGTWGPVIAFVLLIVFFSVMSPDVFPTTGNILSILNDQAVLAIVASGMTVVLLAGEFDLSVGSNLSFTGALTAGLLTYVALPMAIVIPAMIGVGFFIGWFNGILVAYLRIPALIATLAVGTILDGLAIWYTGGNVIFEGMPKDFVSIGRTDVFGMQLPIIIMLAVALCLWAFLKFTPPGRYLHAIGGNREAATMAGIRVKRQVVLAFMVSGGCAGLAGVLQTARNASAHPSIGASFLLPAFAATFLGSATLSRGGFHIAGTILGVYLIATASSGLFILGAPYWTSYLFSGIVLILATASSRLLNRGD